MKILQTMITTNKNYFIITNIQYKNGKNFVKFI